jgi:hypothetical protein
MNPSVRYLLSLVRAALLDIDPPPPEGVDFDQIRRLSACSHLDMMHSRHRVKQDLMIAATADDGAFAVFGLRRAYLGPSGELLIVDDDDDSEVTVSDAT